MRKRITRNQSGAVLPLVMVATLLLVAYLAFAVDVQRNIFAVQQLQFAAESAALDAYAQLMEPQGTIPGDKGLANAQTAVSKSHGGNPWNQAPLGPANADKNGPFNGGVSIDSGDIDFANNPGDANEPVLRVTARRQGSEALRFFFLPAIFAINAMNGDPVPSDAQGASPYRTVEVIGTPAARVGAGSPRSSQLFGWATLPIALSYSQFVAASNADPSTFSTPYIIDLLNSKSPYPPSLGNRIRGAFVNVFPNGSGSAYYGDGQGNVAIDQLLQTWRYFGQAASANETAPAVVERGSKVAVFDTGDTTFASRSAEIQSVLNAVQKNRDYIVPIVAADPVANSRATVVGFALMRLDQVVNGSTGQLAFQFSLSPSFPVRNAAASQAASVPSVTGASLPSPVAGGPFANRIFDMQNNAVSTRYRGVALAPVTSPRTTK
jgi:Flp pilus assembly protein TadG